jgi:ribonuclease HIII
MINDEKLKEIAEKLSDKLSAYDLLKLSKNIIHLVYNDIYYEVKNASGMMLITFPFPKGCASKIKG